MASIHASISDPETTRLAAQNQALAEELAQCQADKEFVWSLWKRLQVANPDVSQAISMVVQREKEKSEIKDRKILEILQTKDDRISALEQMLSVQEGELKAVSSRKTELDEQEAKPKTEYQHQEYEKQDAEERMSQLQKHVEKMQNIIDEKTEALEAVTKEKEDLKLECQELQSSLRESRSDLKMLQELNSQYESKLEELQKGLEDIVDKAKLSSHELDAKTNDLKAAKSKVQELTSLLKTSDQELCSTRQELEELIAKHEQAVQHATQQAQLIQQLQSLQVDTQKVLRNQEDAHSLESSSFQTMYHELRARYEKVIGSERELKKRLAEMESHVTTKPPVRNVCLQVRLDGRGAHEHRSRSRDRGRSKQAYDHSPAVERLLSHDLDDVLQDVKQTNIERATSTPVKVTRRRARSLSPQGHRSVQFDDPEEILSGAPSGHGRISELLDATEHRSRNTRKMSDMRKLLRLKNKEVDELRKAHGRRLERLKVLQTAYDVVKEQIKTYEQQESSDKKRKKLRRSEPKDLRKEDSDAVWNELAYFKQQTTNLQQERMNLDEEVDRLRVQATVDASTIEELTRCLEEERGSLESQLARLQAANKREEREKARAEDLHEKTKKLQKSLQALQDERASWLDEREQLERQLRTMKAELVQLKTTATHKEVQHQALLEQIAKLRVRLRNLDEKMENNKRKRVHPSAGEEQDEDGMMSPGVHIILSDGDGEDWQQLDSDDSDTILPSSPHKRTPLRSQSLSPTRTRSMARSRTSTPKRSRHNRSRSAGPTTPSARQLASVLHHLDRMAKAYEESPAFSRILMSVATQTERVMVAETSMMAGEEGSDDVTTADSSSQSTEGASEIDLVPVVKMRDIATSPIKSLNPVSHVISKKSHKMRGFHSPGPGGVSGLKRRLAALQQQVATLQEQRTMLQRAATEQREQNERLQTDLNLATARLKNTRPTIQRLTNELEESKEQKEALQKEKDDLRKLHSDKHSDADWRSSEARLKSQASEIVRQGSAIKAMKTQAEQQNETIKTLENKIQHLDRDVSQKRSLLDDLRARAKSATTTNKIHAETVKELESKISSLTETLDKRKVEIDSLRKQVAVVTKEKQHYEKLSVGIQDQLDKKSAVLNDITVKLDVAESTLTEMELTASQQLQMLANQSEIALDAAHVKMKHLQTRIQDLETFIKDLALELSAQTQDALDQVLARSKSSQEAKQKDESMMRAQTIASSILNMSTSDLDEFMTVDQDEEQLRVASEIESSKVQDEKWKRQIDAALTAKKLRKEELKKLVMEKLLQRDDAVLMAKQAT